ncbi:MAG: acyloxyacyl hydrolase [Saprospiraceae bacterium]
MKLRVTYNFFGTSIWCAGIILMLSLLNETTFAQTGFPKDLYLKAAYRPGFVLPEYTLFNYLVDDYVHSFELSISKQTTGGDWAQVYHYPEYGLAFQYSTLGNEQVFGHEFSLYPYFTIHIIDAGKFSFQNQIGLGLGVVNKKFDQDNNPYNVAVGTNVNLHFNFELNAQYQVQRKLFLYTGLCMDHLSNGNLGEPNLGINFLTFNAGVRYLPGEKSERTRVELTKHIPTTQAAIILAAGSKHARSLQSRSYFISSLSFEVKRKLSRIFYPGIGADIFYDAATQAEVFNFGDSEYKSIDAFKTGVHIEEELVFNKFSIALQEGFYLGLTEKAFNNKTYNRFIIRHRVGEKLFVQLAMKSHVAVLDFLEFGIGYTGRS